MIFVQVIKKDNKNVSHAVKTIINMQIVVFKTVQMDLLNLNNQNHAKNVLQIVKLASIYIQTIV